MSHDRHVSRREDIRSADVPPDAAPDVLVVCTANIARSPLLAVRLQHEADRRLGPGTAVIGSAGTEARFGDRAASGSREIAERWGSSLETHASRSVMYVPLVTVPLIVAMTRRHVRALRARTAGIAPRTFTLEEIVRCLEAADVDGALPASPPGSRAQFRERVALVANLADEHRPAWRSLRRELDVPDPVGSEPGTYDHLGERFTAAGKILADTLFGAPTG